MEIEKKESKSKRCGEPIVAGLFVIGSDRGPAPIRLDMGIYWRQPHQSAPHLINEPERCVEKRGLHKLCVCVFAVS